MRDERSWKCWGACRQASGSAQISTAFVSRCISSCWRAIYAVAAATIIIIISTISTVLKLLIFVARRDDRCLFLPFPLPVGLLFPCPYVCSGSLCYPMQELHMLGREGEGVADGGGRSLADTTFADDRFEDLEAEFARAMALNRKLAAMEQASDGGSGGNGGRTAPRQLNLRRAPGAMEATCCSSHWKFGCR